MVGKDYPLLYDNDFLDKIEKVLDSDNARDNVVNYLKKDIETFKWESRVPTWFNNWKFLEPNSFDMIGDGSESYKKIVDYIHKENSVTKKQILEYMGWGVRISFNSYRNRLRTEKTIKFTKDRYEVI